MTLTDFVRVATTTPSADNSQPWCFTESAGRISCYYHPRHEPDPFGPLGHGTLMSAGALHETLSCLFGASAETGVSRSIGKTGWSISFASELLDSIDANAIVAVRDRHTNRLPYKALGSRALPDLDAVGSCRVSTIVDAGQIRTLADSLRKCSEARFNDPSLHEWLFSSIRWSDLEASSGEGLDIATLHLPPGGRSFMKWISPWSRMSVLNRLGVYKLLAIGDSRLFRQAPAVVALTGPDDVEAGWDAGRALQRAWITLNRSGFAVHPYYVVTDIGRRLRTGLLAPEWCDTVEVAVRQAGRSLGLDTKVQIHMLLRVGLPTAQPVRSQRLPPEAFIVGG